VKPIIGEAQFEPPVVHPTRVDIESAGPRGFTIHVDGILSDCTVSVTVKSERTPTEVRINGERTLHPVEVFWNGTFIAKDWGTLQVKGLRKVEWTHS